MGETSPAPFVLKPLRAADQKLRTWAILCLSVGRGLSRQPGDVLRGGSWNNNQNNARAAYRNNNNPNNRNNNNGFRLVCGVSHVLPPLLLAPGNDLARRAVPPHADLLQKQRAATASRLRRRKKNSAGQVWSARMMGSGPEGRSATSHAVRRIQNRARRIPAAFRFKDASA